MKLRIIILVASLTAAFAAQAADFKVRAPATWKISEALNESDYQSTIYKNSKSTRNETVVTSSFAVELKDPDFQENLQNQKANVEKAVGSFYASAGLANYTVLDITQQKSPQGGMRQVIQARFRDLDGRVVQMLEREYVAHGKMYVVTYLVDSLALNDLEHVNTVLNTFVPIITKDRAPASELVNADASSAAPTAGESVDQNAAPEAIHELNMSDIENQKRCESVPVEKRRTEKDTNFTGLIKDNLAAGKGCVMGVVDSAIGLVKGVYEIGKFSAKYAWS